MSFCIAKEYPNLCTGCEACVQACPYGAISMVKNEEGFFYPEFNYDLCNDCGVCGDVCPECGEQCFDRRPLPIDCLAATHKNRSVLIESSSGGAFSALASLTDDSCIIYGAAYQDDLTVHHYAALKDENFYKLQKSKYVQSRIGDSFREIKEYLQTGKQVLFSGTPCQIAGLRNFLGRDYDQLICIEIICHGVGSPGVFADYLCEYEKTEDSRPVSFIFRHKKGLLGSWSDFLTTITFENGKSYSTRFDPYTIGFLKSLFLRKSCLTCPYANEMRVSDIVIGDFWGIEKKHPNFFCKDGVSLVLPITKKGAILCAGLSSVMSVIVTPTADAFYGNSILLHPKETVEGRDAFFKAYAKMGVSEAFLQYVPIPGRLHRIFAYLPNTIKNILRKLKP